MVLLFFLLQKATRLVLRSALVAALFAVHPLNVECVAWVAERKSLLSMFFLLPALAAYGWYSENRSTSRYLLVAGAFALGLAAKPMIVTLPILLLLCDYWPLERVAAGADVSVDHHAAVLLVAEKIPLFALSAASSWVTIYAQHGGGALGSTDLLPLAWRIENAIYSYAAYVGKGLWPSGLAVFYPHPEGSLPLWKVLAAGVLVAGSAVLAWRYRESSSIIPTLRNGNTSLR